MFSLGLIINPIAGVGGSVALKGSDGVAEQALAEGAIKQANTRARLCLEELRGTAQQVRVYTASGEMGQQLCEDLGLQCQVVHQAAAPTSAEDTKLAAQAIEKQAVDLLLFAGGDGTARDIYQALEGDLLCLGIPAGCKIHSGVYGVTPKASGKLLRQVVEGKMLSLKEAEVRDIDETAFRQGTVRARHYGELQVPDDLHYVQSVKQGGMESEELVLADIAAQIIEDMEPDTYYIFGSGSTVAAIAQDLSLPNTLLGVDLILNHEIIAEDLTANQLVERIRGVKSKLLLTPIGGQGHLFGRGNQQLSPALIKLLGRDNIIVVASKTKLNSLHGRPLIVDTGDTELDKSLSGNIKVTTGYRDYVMYRVSNPENEVADAQDLCPKNSEFPD